MLSDCLKANSIRFKYAFIYFQPIIIKTEPIDEDEMPNSMENEIPNNTNDTIEDTIDETNNKDNLQNLVNNPNLTPVVRLNRLPVNSFVDITPTVPKTEPSARYWKLMEEMADHDLKLKMAQRENEEERMEFERELHRKNVFLLDLKIRVETEKLETYNQNFK